MPTSLFISYSRHETPFVDVLLDALEDSGLRVWVDYHSLVPGKPWLEQILTGVDTADVLLLVVSRASIESRNVEQEYQRALEQKKRVLLIIFEAVPLPASLQTSEWIDFRGSFKKKFKQLLMELDKPGPRSPAPQSGFKASSTVWLTLLISLVAVAISIPAWWTIFIPVLLIPLPQRILKRDFHFYRVRFALLTLPVVLLLSWVFFLSYPFTNIPFTYCLLASFLITPALLILLTSRGMRIWGRPSASAPRFANLYHPEVEQPKSVPFFIEYAPEDTKYANAIIKGLTRYGHSHVEDLGQAEISFAVISRFKNTISINPEVHIVFPIIIQDTLIEDINLQRIQWIDFRRGLRNLDNLAKLLPEPAKVTKALGVVPFSGQVIYPRIIQMLDYFLALLAFFSVSVWIPLWFEFGRQFLKLENSVLFLSFNAILSAIILATVFHSRQALINRKGRLASLGALIGSTLLVGLVALLQTLYILNSIITIVNAGPRPEGDLRGSVIMFLPLSYILGTILIGFFGIWNLGDLARWFPKRRKV